VYSTSCPSIFLRNPLDTVVWWVLKSSMKRLFYGPNVLFTDLLLLPLPSLSIRYTLTAVNAEIMYLLCFTCYMSTHLMQVAVLKALGAEIVRTPTSASFNSPGDVLYGLCAVVM